MKIFLFAVACGLFGLSQAHMEMEYPPPLRSKNNTFVPQDKRDWSMSFPLQPNGSDFPCKGYLNLLNTSEGSPTASFEVGKEYNMTIRGGTAHGGGSCQASLSFDQGNTWKVIHSYIGNCPSGNVSLDFTIPSNAPSARAVFAWTWFNNIGNREMYMNCAVVNITGGSSSNLDGALSQCPGIFVANIGNNCSTKEGYDLEFPTPGKYVDEESKNLSPPIGNNCSVEPGIESDENDGGGNGNNTSDKDDSGSAVLTTNKWWMWLGHSWILLFLFY